MKKVILAVFGVVLTAGLVYAAAELSNSSGNKTYSWRYKMTVEVETPEGIKTGSAVREATVLFIPTGNTHPKARKYNDDISLKGEAIVVDLGEQGKVFAVQSSDDYDLPFKVFKGPPGLTMEGAEHYSELQGKGELGQEHYPKFVAFEDINDPLSVQLVYKSETRGFGKNAEHTFHDNFEKIYGSGFKLKRILIEMTDEPVQYKIWGILPLLGNIKVGRLDGNRLGTIYAENRIANRLSVGSFTTDEGKK